MQLRSSGPHSRELLLYSGLTLLHITAHGTYDMNLPTLEESFNKLLVSILVMGELVLDSFQFTGKLVP